MDEIDLKLLKLLWEDPRCSYRDLADSLGISTPAVHRRIQAAREAEIIVGPFARLSPKFVGAVQVMVFGRTEAANLNEVMRELGKGDSTYIVTMMTGNVLLLRSLLKDIGDLDSYIGFVRKVARMPEPEIGLTPDEAGEYAEPDRSIKLNKLDFKIMQALCSDGRKNVNEIAEEIHVSPKTVRNHLNRLIDCKILTFELIGNQAQSGNFVPMLQVHIEKDADKKDIIININKGHRPPLISIVPFSNHPHMFLAFGWLQNMAQLGELVSGIEAEDGVKTVVPYVFVKSGMLKTWLDRLLEDPEKAMDFCARRKLL